MFRTQILLVSVFLCGLVSGETGLLRSSTIQGKTPSGLYHGSKKILGTNVDAKLMVRDTTVDLTISGAVKIHCENEAYSMDQKGNVKVSGSKNKGDCVHNGLAKFDLSLESVTYGDSKDTITITVKQSKFIKVSLILAHQSLEYVQDVSVANGACTNEDISILIKSNFASDMKVCGKKCWGAKACVSKCMSTKEGISTPCADCYGAESQCVSKHCFATCMSNPDGEACKTCATSHCETGAFACSGFTPPSVIASVMFGEE